MVLGFNLCGVFDPLVQLYQNWLDVTYQVVGFLGLTAPNARDYFGGLLGCTF